MTTDATRDDGDLDDDAPLPKGVRRAGGFTPARGGAPFDADRLVDYAQMSVDVNAPHPFMGLLSAARDGDMVVMRVEDDRGKARIIRLEDPETAALIPDRTVWRNQDGDWDMAPLRATGRRARKAKPKETEADGKAKSENGEAQADGKPKSKPGRRRLYSRDKWLKAFGRVGRDLNDIMRKLWRSLW